MISLAVEVKRFVRLTKKILYTWECIIVDTTLSEPTPGVHLEKSPRGGKSMLEDIWCVRIMISIQF